MNSTKNSTTFSDVKTPPRTLVESTYRQVRCDIIEGRLVPGEKLRVEHLKDQYRIGSGTLREALTMLLSDALVTSEGQRGFYVASISLKDIKDITDTRVLLETEALRHAMKTGDDEWEANLIAAFHKLGKIDEKLGNRANHLIREWEDRNRHFHEALISACDSNWLHSLISMLYRHSERYRYLTISSQTVFRDVHAEHTLIFEAALSRDTKRASRALEQHIRLTFESIKASPELIAKIATYPLEPT
jgi:DNA-binding GntR family transcriptional regulator